VATLVAVPVASCTLWVSLPVSLVVVLLLPVAPVWMVVIETRSAWLGLLLGGAVIFAAIVLVLVVRRRSAWSRVAVRIVVVLAWLLAWLVLLGVLEPISWGAWTKPHPW
jgi:hypothetical protein